MYGNGQTVTSLLDELAPKRYAVEDDRIGLQVGSLAKEVRRVLVTLDVTEEVADEAIREGAELIIAHHAPIYRPLKSLRTDTPAGKVFEKLIKHDVAVYVAHSNLDAAVGGINDLMADAIGLTDTVPLDPTYTERRKKLVVYVPTDHADQVADALFRSGAGHIGRYSHCSFRSNGTGTFLPLTGTNPFIGQEGQLEQVDEIRLETILSETGERRVVRAMLEAHPYEEPAYDLYPLELPGETFGIGRTGKLAQPCTLDELAERVKTGFEVPFVRIVGRGDTVIKKAAVLGGMGADYVSHAQFAGADVLITGDIDYHTAHDALAAGMCLIDPGHNAEKIMRTGVADYLNRRLRERKLDTIAMASSVDTEVFRLR
ncbi:Nif3-like dinuclear metal center hexameric protein [Gorillibacterium timonense]|uniref:Nif3-like dinuclear metal center hexameric protein n=1 Tax=Gorillibacterium timonense TaxID=1689269 RepID=UPI00071CEBB7|nr:Nif3-like dinuclear metal center hexameric protein [Gorillibacterium timonense]